MASLLEHLAILTDPRVERTRADRQGEATIAETFGPANLFIDSCPDVVHCYSGPFLTKRVGLVPGGPIGTCWSRDDLICEPCNGHSIDYYNYLCNETYPDQCPTKSCIITTA